MAITPPCTLRRPSLLWPTCGGWWSCPRHSFRFGFCSMSIVAGMQLCAYCLSACRSFLNHPVSIMFVLFPFMEGHAMMRSFLSSYHIELDCILPGHTIGNAIISVQLIVVPTIHYRTIIFASSFIMFDSFRTELSILSYSSTSISMVTFELERKD